MYNISVSLCKVETTLPPEQIQLQVYVTYRVSIVPSKVHKNQQFPKKSKYFLGSWLKKSIFLRFLAFFGIFGYFRGVIFSFFAFGGVFTLVNIMEGDHRSVFIFLLFQFLPFFGIFGLFLPFLHFLAIFMGCWAQNGTA